jgi:uncharacterized protein (TIGR02996 family)
MDTTLAGLIQGCAEALDDNAPRLILADWLEDHGLPERAELVRLQCRLADWVPDWQERQTLIARQYDLIATHQENWLGPLTKLCHRVEFVRGLCRVWVKGNVFAAPRSGKALTATRATALIEQVRVVECQDLAPLAARPWVGWVPGLSLVGLDLDADAVAPLLNSSHLDHLVDLDLTGNRCLETGLLDRVDSDVFARLTRLAVRSPLFSPVHLTGLLDRFGPRLRELDLGAGVLSPHEFPRLASLLPASRLRNSLGMEFVRIPAGSFLMGAPADEPGMQADESPRHPVTLTRPFWLGRFAVTQRQYEALMSATPSEFPGPLHPVERVNHIEVREFCHRLGLLTQEMQAGRTYRLPTEAEWEHACRAGAFTAYHTGPTHSMELMNCQKRFDTGNPERVLLNRTADVGSYPPNAFGLYEMHGNVWEWCADHHDARGYSPWEAVDPVRSAGSGGYVARGGCWEAIGSYCRSAKRYGADETNSSRYRGFRVVLVTAE